MTWKTVVSKTETEHVTQPEIQTFHKKEQAYLQFLDIQECCVISQLFLQFNCNNQYSVLYSDPILTTGTFPLGKTMVCFVNFESKNVKTR